MQVLVDINHPAHAHFFRRPIDILRDRGHEILVTSRDKDITLKLLDSLAVEHQVLSAQRRGGLAGLALELISRNRQLRRIVRDRRPDVMTAIGGTFVAQVGRLTGVPSVVFYDTENAKLQNLLTYPFASCVAAPQCYESWLPRRHLLYCGYHELSYLHPDVFRPDRDRAIANGLAPEGDTFFLRLVAWRANHDVRERGWSADLVRRVVSHLEQHGRVLISAEGLLPDELEHHRYRGNPHEVHHVMAFARLFVGESATMASECAVLGTPAIYAATTGRGYTNEQERRYGLVVNVFELEWPRIQSTINQMLDRPRETWSDARSRLLDDTVAVASYAADCIEDHREQLRRYRG